MINTAESATFNSIVSSPVVTCGLVTQSHIWLSCLLLTLQRLSPKGMHAHATCCPWEQSSPAPSWFFSGCCSCYHECPGPGIKQSYLINRRPLIGVWRLNSGLRVKWIKMKLKYSLCETNKNGKISAVCPRWMGIFLLFFFPSHAPMTLLSETNYAECQSGSLSNRLCCCGSLEGRSFILLSPPICPRGFCSSVAESVPLLCLFISLTTSSGCVSECVCVCVCVCGREGERERERERERVCVPVQNWLHVLVAQRDLCVEHVCAPVRMQVSLQCLRSAHSRLMAYRSCNTFFSFNTISKPQHSTARFPKLLIQPSVQPVLGIGKALYSCTVNAFLKCFANSETHFF